MTVCLVAKFNNPEGEPFISIAADSAVTDMDNGTRWVNLENFTKLFPLKDGVVAVCGGGPVSEVLEDLQASLDVQNAFDTSTKLGVRNMAARIFGELKDCLVASIVDEGMAAKDVGELLIATPSGLYVVYPDLTIFSFKEFWASGIGANFALGAMQVLYSNLKKQESITHDDLDKAMIEAIKAANSHSIACGSPIHLQQITGKRKFKKA